MASKKGRKSNVGDKLDNIEKYLVNLLTEASKEMGINFEVELDEKKSQENLEQGLKNLDAPSVEVESKITIDKSDVRKQSQMSRKEKFKALIKRHGYSSINNFCVENKMNQSNFNGKLNDENIQPTLPSLFQLANILHEPIDIIIEIFYPEEFQENRELTNEGED